MLLAVAIALHLPVISVCAEENLDLYEQLRASQKKSVEEQQASKKLPPSKPEPRPTDSLDLNPPTPTSQVEHEQLTIETPKIDKKPQTKSSEQTIKPEGIETHLESLRISGRTQLDFRQHQQAITDQKTPLKNSQFAIRRARLEFHGSLSPNISFKSSIDVADSVKTKDVYIDVKTKNGLTWRGGQFKYPFGNENVSSSRYYEFLEMSTISNTLSSNRDRGLLINGSSINDKLIYNLGMVSGTGTKTTDQNSGLDFFVHAEALVFENKSKQTILWVGGSASSGKQQSSNTNSLEIFPESESGLVLFSTDLPNDASYNRQRYAIDAKIVYGSFFIGAEHLNADYTYTSKASINGSYVMASYFLTGEQRSIEDGELARQHILRPITGTDGWGAWEIALRYSQFKVSDNFFIDDGLFAGWQAIDEAENARLGKAWSIGLNWYPSKQVRVMLNWVQTKAKRFDGTTNAYVVLKAEDALLARGQIEF